MIKSPELALAFLPPTLSILPILLPKAPCIPSLCPSSRSFSQKAIISIEIKRLPNNVCQISKNTIGNFHSLKKELCPSGKILIVLKCLWATGVGLAA